jgi:hypothetical protein
MSFILQALNKQQSSVTDATKSQHANQAQLTSNPPTSFIGWGILLTLAIFIALILGYWLGAQQTQVNDPAQVELAPSYHEQTRLDGTVSVKPATVTAAAIEVVAHSDSEIVEHYFDNPDAYQQPISASSNNQALAVKPIAQPPNHALTLSVQAAQGVSDELLSRMQVAISETGSNASAQPVTTATNHLPELAIASIAELPATVKNALPSIHFTMHIYASDGESWVRVNGADKRPGDMIDLGLELAEIRPQQVLLRFQQQLFYMPALSNWQ